MESYIITSLKDCIEDLNVAHILEEIKVIIKYNLFRYVFVSDTEIIVAIVDKNWFDDNHEVNGHKLTGQYYELFDTVTESEYLQALTENNNQEVYFRFFPLKLESLIN